MFLFSWILVLPFQIYSTILRLSTQYYSIEYNLVFQFHLIANGFSLNNFKKNSINFSNAADLMKEIEYYSRLFWLEHFALKVISVLCDCLKTNPREAKHSLTANSNDTGKQSHPMDNPCILNCLKCEHCVCECFCHFHRFTLVSLCCIVYERECAGCDVFDIIWQLPCCNSVLEFLNLYSVLCWNWLRKSLWYFREIC